MATVSKEYAEALFTLALEENSIDDFYSALSMMQALFSENPEYIEFLSTPSIPKAERVQQLTKCFEGKVPDIILHFAIVMVERGDIHSFNDSVMEYENLSFAMKSVSNATAISAVPLTEEEKVRLIRKLERLCTHTVLLHCKVDPSLIGGMIIEIDGRVIDGSIKHRMRELKGIISE